MVCWTYVSPMILWWTYVSPVVCVELMLVSIELILVCVELMLVCVGQFRDNVVNLFNLCLVNWAVWSELWLKFYDLSCDVCSMSCSVIWAVCDQTCCTTVIKEDEIQCRFLVPFVMIRMYSMMKMDMFCDEKMLQWKTRTQNVMTCGAKYDDTWRDLKLCTW